MRREKQVRDLVTRIAWSRDLRDDEIATILDAAGDLARARRRIGKLRRDLEYERGQREGAAGGVT
jgi:DNA-directed RNA polymerase specialized sigma54-like protein